MQHNIKIRPEFWNHIAEGLKDFDVRLNDRNYQVGDTIFFDVLPGPGESCHLSPGVTYRIKYVHSGLGLQDGYVVLGIVPVILEGQE